MENCANGNGNKDYITSWSHLKPKKESWGIRESIVRAAKKNEHHLVWESNCWVIKEISIVTENRMWLAMGLMPRLVTKMWINAQNTKQLKTFDLGIAMQGNGFDNDKNNTSRKSVEK